MNPLIITILIISILCFTIVPLYLLYIYYNINDVEFTDIRHGCLYNRYGCCNDKLTPKLDPFGSNCRGF